MEEEPIRRAERLEIWNAGQYLWIWLAIGVQSFGGGATTLTLIRQAAVDRFYWMTDEEFTREWALVQVVPGINLLAITILIGKRVRGVTGIVLALAGLLSASVTLTILITAGYAQIRHLHWVQAALRGIVPASVGLGLLTSWQMLRPPIIASKQEGSVSLAACLAVFVLSGVAVMWLHWPTFLVLILGGVVCVLFRSRRISSDAEEGSA